MIYLFYALISLLMIAADIVTKVLTVENMPLGSSIPLWDGVFHLTHIRNTGAAFSILSGQRFFLIALPLIVVLAVIAYVIIKKLRRIFFFSQFP